MNPKRPCTALWIAIGLAWGAVVCVAAPASARSPSCEQVERFTLKNGLEVVLVPDHELPNVALVSSVHAGSRNDPPGYEGLAHYVEHLTFLEALKLGSVNELYEQAGATGVNATTSPDTTDYFAQLPRAQLERGLWIEARRIAIGIDTVSPGPAEDEHQVILREHQQRYGNGLGLEFRTTFFEALFPDGHPYHAIRRQTESSVAGLGLADARWFFARYYRPDRIRLSLVGDFDPAAVRPLIDKYFAALAPRELPPASGAPALSQAETDAAECRRADVPRAALHGSVVLSRRYRGEAVAFLWLPAVGDDPQRWSGIMDAFGRRVSVAVHDAKVAGAVQMELVEGEFGDYWELGMELLPAQSIESVITLVQAAFAELKRSPPNAGEQTAERQSLELRESLERSLLSRAQNLSRRECKPARCLTPAEEMSAETIAGMDQFDPAKALRLELRHSYNVSSDGDVERVP